jgi:hypothetical protein
LKIHPHAWLFTIPITIGLVQIYWQPADNIIKRMYRELLQLESFVWARLGVAPAWPGRLNVSNRQIRKSVYGLIIAGFAFASMASFGAFLGVLK